MILRSNDIDRLIKLLGLRGFDYTLRDDEIVIDISEYFDIDRFMEIVDLLRFNSYYELGHPKKILRWQILPQRKSLLRKYWPSWYE